MNANFLSACLFMLGAAIALAAPPPSPPREQVTGDPNDPEKTRPMVPREEREKLGLTPHTWSGVVHPDVYPTLDKLNRTVASLKDRLNKARDPKAFETLHRVRFEGTVYVQVQLKDKNAQRRVLGSLKATEFHARQLFETLAGFVGHATKEGLDKLAKNPDVVAVSLDDKPLPGPDKIMAKDFLPPPKSGDTSSEQPGVKEGKIDSDVYRAFDMADRVDVSISLRKESLPALTGARPEMRAQWELRKQAETELQNRVLSTVSADDFFLSGRLGPGMGGHVTKEGLEKLWKHSDVRKIYLEQLRRIPERQNGKRFSPGHVSYRSVEEVFYV